MQERFSVVAYANNRDDSGFPDKTEQDKAAEVREGREAWFQNVVEELRGELIAARGRTEEERQAYTETLNRAVLGYETERRKMLAVIQDLLAKKRIQGTPPSSVRYPTLAEAVFAEVIGWNVLEMILQNREGLEEIQVVGERIYEVREGIPTLSAHRLGSVKELERLQQNLVLFNGDTLNIRKRWAEVTLRDGSRVTMTGFGFTSVPTLTIRFYNVRVHDLDQLAGPRYETMTVPMAELLRSLVRSGINLAVTGPTNSGKTTLIKSLIREMPDHERLVTIESRFELMIKRDFPEKNVLEYETDDDDPKHSGKQAFKLALRQSPKRICHAEIRDDDANIYVRACTRGHEGSVTTVHANQLEDVPEAITDMCMMDGRGMDAGRLVRRIAEYVTQIGLEMAIVGGRRKLVRIGEFEYAHGEIRVRDWVIYDYGRKAWVYPLDLSEKAVSRFARNDPEGLERLNKLREETAACS